MARTKTTHFFQWLLLSLIGGFIAGLIGSFAIVSSIVHTPEPADPSVESVEKIIDAPSEKSIADIVALASPAVVSVLVEADVSVGGDRRFRGFFGDLFDPNFESGDTMRQQIGGGSGFIISPDGLILTNRHVVTHQNAIVSVMMSDGREYPAEILAVDPLNDIALLSVDAENLPVLSLGDSTNIQIGQTVLAIGNALGEFSNSVTKGIISGINRRITAGNSASLDTIESAIQTDAAINSGNSGGPLLDEDGFVIGINTAVSRAGQSIGFAIPVNTAKVVVESFKKHGRIVRPWLGVRYVLLTPELDEMNKIGASKGAFIVTDGPADPGVLPDSPAAKAGLRDGDVIVKIDGVEVGFDHPPSELITAHKVGDVIQLEIIRAGKTKTLSATLEELDPSKL